MADSAHEPPHRKSTTFRVRVGYGDTDQAHVVHHAVYLRWLEQARIEYLRENGLEYKRWEAGKRLGLPVVEAKVRYRAPARFDDRIEVETRVGALLHASVTFESSVRCEGRLLAEGSIRLACVGLDDGKVVRIPEEVRRACVGAP